MTVMAPDLRLGDNSLSLSKRCKILGVLGETWPETFCAARPCRHHCQACNPGWALGPRSA
jgi:hypothetical protein